jgi:predicted RNA-binding Zn-ribbon protein involved in translation (DUF1610 family)
MDKVTFVNSPAEFPNWKAACPKCGAKYPQPAVSVRRDNSAAWCKSCGWNWKITNKAQGSASSDKNPDGFKIMADEFVSLRNKVEELITTIKESVLGQ